MASQGGIVKTYFCDKGYGFISSQGARRVIFHIKEVVGQQIPINGDKVRFEMGTSRGKPCAQRVQIESLSGYEQEWFAAILEQDDAKLCSLAASGQDVNAVCRDKQPCPRCGGSGLGQGGYSGEDICITRRHWDCGVCEGEKSVRPMQTGVTLAVENDKPNSLQTLISLGADVNKQSPLCQATLRKNAQLVHALLVARANPNLEKGADASAPLMVAARRGDKSIVQILLEAGADPNATEIDDIFDDYCDEVEFVTADSVARRQGHHDIACAIRDWKQQKPLQLHILSQDLDTVDLSVTCLSGSEVARFPVALQDPSTTLLEKLQTLASSVGGKIRLVMPDTSICTVDATTELIGTMNDFLGLGSATTGHSQEEREVSKEQD
mmetsp:Transcript_124756/g.216310  ORF Transcript_124756/g.216310 Transcript_124756/m.216310 type:complete len:381 (-) Transcript_124756:113-1255(-)